MGVQLAAILRQAKGSDLSPGILQGIVADVVGSHVKLLLPLRHLLASPGFRSLIPLAGSGKGFAERDALLQDIQETFSPQLVHALKEVLTGFLALDANAFAQGVDIPEPVIDDPAPSFPEQGRRDAASPGPSANPPFASTPAASPQPTSFNILPSVVALLLLGTGALLATRVPPFCTRLGLCTSAISASSQRALDQARQAAKQLANAADLGSYQKSSQDLNASLLKLGGIRMSPEPSKELLTLQELASQANARTVAEQADRDRLLSAREAIDSARDTSGQERLALLEKASSALDGIGANSFSASDAAELRDRIASLKQVVPAEPAEAPSPSSPPTQTDPAAAPTWSPPPQAQAPAPTMSAPPVSRPSAAPRPDGSAPYRSQPLF